MPGSPPPNQNAAVLKQCSYGYIVADLWAWARGRRRRFVVGGGSMLPTLEPGWFLLMDPDRTPSKGQIVVAHHPNHSSTVVVKRVQRILEDASLWVLSDNTDSGNDSRHFGPVKPAEVLGVVTLVLDHPRRGVF